MEKTITTPSAGAGSAESAETQGAGVLELATVRDRDADEIAELMEGGALEVRIDGAMSEWGSLIEDFFAKLERGVTRWHHEGEEKTVVVRFVERE